MADETVEPLKQKTCILKASIHCEGCKRKVKKILSQVSGVEFVDVDSKQHKVTVTGDVDAGTLIRKLIKSGKNAELWPQPQISHEIGKSKEKEIEINHAEASSTSDNGEASTKIEKADKNPEGSAAAPVEASEGGGDAKATAEVQDIIKSEEKKSDESCSAAGDKPHKEEPGKNNSGGGTPAKKKKTKGKNVNQRGLESPEPPSPATNQSPPRNHRFEFTPPPAYAVSYNSAYPPSSYTASYYAAPPPHAHAFVHTGSEIPPPLDDELNNPRQPLDSFEMFSDENPNGCFIM